MQTELSRDPDGVTHRHQCTVTGQLWLDCLVFVLLGLVLDEPRHPASQTRGVFVLGRQKPFAENDALVFETINRRPVA